MEKALFFCVDEDDGNFYGALGCDLILISKYPNESNKIEFPEWQVLRVSIKSRENLVPMSDVS